MFDIQELQRDLIAKRVFEIDISMEEAANQIGISRSAYSRIENGKLPGVDTLATFCVWLNASSYRVFKVIDTLDTEEFRKDLVSKRVLENNLTMSEAAKQIGISKSTYSRIERGSLPAVETLAKCMVWLEIKNIKYFYKSRVIKSLH